MRAINLMATDGDGPGPRSAARSTYVVLGVLAALVVVSGAWAISSRQVSERQVQLSTVSAEAAAAEARAQATAPMRTFAEQADARAEAIKSLSATRFDWAQAMRAISRTLPADVWLTSMAGTSSATGEPAADGSAAPLPTFAIDGCTVNQSKVARLMRRLRAVKGVDRVELQASEKATAASEGATACGKGGAGEPQFSMSIFYTAAGGDAAAAAAAATAAAPGAAGATTTPPSNDAAESPR